MLPESKENSISQDALLEGVELPLTVISWHWEGKGVGELRGVCLLRGGVCKSKENQSL